MRARYKPLMPLDAVLFDMDGVLVKSEEVWFRAVEEAGVRFRGRPITREEFFPTFGQGTAADIPYFGLNTTRAELDAFYVEGFLRHISEMWVNPDAAPLLSRLREKGLKIALVTNTVAPLAARILETAKLNGFFHSLATSDRVTHAKPSPELPLLALKELGVDAARAVMVGDSKYDREAAKAAGVRFAGLGIDGDVRLERLADFQEA